MGEFVEKIIFRPEHGHSVAEQAERATAEGHTLPAEVPDATHGGNPLSNYFQHHGRHAVRATVNAMSREESTHGINVTGPDEQRAEAAERSADTIFDAFNILK